MWIYKNTHPYDIREWGKYRICGDPAVDGAKPFKDYSKRFYEVYKKRLESEIEDARSQIEMINDILRIKEEKI